MAERQMRIEDRAFELGLKAAIAKLELGSHDDLKSLANLVVNDAKKNVKVDTGVLRASIGIQSEGKTLDGSFVEVGTRVNYGPYLEYGTAPHTIRIKKKKVLANQKKGEVFGQEVHHPGTAPRPFMRPALITAPNRWRPKGIK